jgi:hypothetical protein
MRRTIRDVTSPADPVTPPRRIDVSGQTSGYYAYVNFTTSGGSFVVAVNGTDFMQLYSTTFDWTAVNGLATYQLNFDAQTVNFPSAGTVTGGTSGAVATIVKNVDNGATGSLVQSITGTFVRTTKSSPARAAVRQRPISRQASSRSPARHRRCDHIASLACLALSQPSVVHPRRNDEGKLSSG